jgi:hypothetical protein
LWKSNRQPGSQALTAAAAAAVGGDVEVTIEAARVG